MSKKKPRILGPDGKPYVAPPQPVSPEPKPRASGGYTFTYMGLDITNTVMNGLNSITDTPKRTRAKETLASAVKRQVSAIVPEDMESGVEELPKPEPDLHTYRDAFASAQKKCPHQNAESTTYAANEWYCTDCHRYFTGRRSIWGGWE